MKINCIGNYNINRYEWVCARGCTSRCEAESDDVMFEGMFEDSFVGDVFEIDGETVISFPDALIEAVDWREGDQIDFKVEDGTLVLVNLSLQQRKPS
jgi:hypothetical protein